MARYISLVNWTDQGIAAFKDTTDRADAAAELAKGLGAELQEIYWCLGPYDIVAILEAPDDETATAFSLKLGSGGHIRTATMRAFSREEMSAIIDKAG
jgi:uncharacterized protein with GYD domain